MSGIDSNTVLMLHNNGTDASPVFTDDSLSAHTVTTVGNAQIDTAQSKFGGASGLFDGSADGLTVPNSTDWDWGSGDFTVEAWIRFGDLGNNTVYARTTSGTSYTYFTFEGTNLRFRDYNGSNNIDMQRGVSIATGVWYHVAITRSGNNFRMFLDGVQQGTTFVSGNTFITRTDNIEIGSGSFNSGYVFNGHLDEVRISKGIARWTGNFIPLDSEYDTSDPTYDSFTKLISHFNDIDTSVNMIDDSSFRHVMTAVGNAQIDTAQSKFGGSSALFDNSGDAVNISDSDDWAFGTEDFTIDYWVRFNGIAANDCMISPYDDGGSNRCYISIDTGGNNAIEFTATSGGTTLAHFRTPNGSVTTGQWYHIALVRDGNNEHIFINGVSQTLTYNTNPDATTDYPNVSTVCRIGAQAFGWYLDGHMDEVRISKGIARWTANFTPPTTEYPLDVAPTVDENETINISDEIGMQINTDLGSEGVDISDNAIIKFGKSAIESEEIKISDEIEIDASVNAPEGVEVSDDILAFIPVHYVTDEEGIEISDTIDVSIAQPADFATRILSVNPLVFVSDTDPLEITKVDTTDPNNPTWVVYPITNTGETVRNAKDVAYNSVEDALYVATAEGKILKVDFTDFNTREEIDLGDTDDLINIEAHEDFSRIITSTDQADGEVIILNDVEILNLSTDIRTILDIKSSILTSIETTFASSIGLDVTTLLEKKHSLSVDVRVIALAFNEIAHNVIDRPDWDVAINGVLVPDVKWDNINVRHMADEKSQVTFTLGRRHDELNKTIDGVSSIITNQNPVTVIIDGRLEFSGNIIRIQSDSENESVQVIAESTKTKPIVSKTISVPMSTLNTKLHPYDVLVHNPNIYNPIIDVNDDNSIYYKGIKADLGQITTQNLSRGRKFVDMPFSMFFTPLVLGQPSLGSTALDIMEGNFKPKQNWTYFWGNVIAENFNTGNINEAFYVGTSMSGFSSDIWELIQVNYRLQRIFDDIITGDYSYSVDTGSVVEVDLDEDELKELPEDADHSLKVRQEYRIGSAPYQEISPRNGAFFPKWRWEDSEDGLYDILDGKYDFRDYVVKMANLEYERLTNINGNVFPQSGASLEIMLDGYYYYGISLLTRINVTNTTTSGIYKNVNGFPISVKAIDINSGSMRVTLTCDNIKSQGELEDINNREPNEEDFMENPRSVFLIPKFDVNRDEEVE